MAAGTSATVSTTQQL